MARRRAYELIPARSAIAVVSSAPIMSDDTQTADRVWVQDKVIVDEETRFIIIINKKLVNPVQYSMRFARQVGHHTERKISNFIPVFVRAGACLSMEETLLRLLKQAEQYIAEQTSANLPEKS